MQLRIKQRVFSWTDAYDVYDEFNRAKYYVKAEFLTLGHQIHVYDKATGRELGSVHQRLFTLLPTFEIIMDGIPQGTIRKRLRLLRQDYEMEFHGWDVEGDFIGWDYRVMQGNIPVMSISRELLQWGDTYVLDYQNPAFELPGLLLVIAIDAANCDDK